MLSIAPSTEIIASIRARNLTWKVGLGELIDNAFDAGAARVSVRFQKEASGLSLRIEDDGNGCDSLSAMLTLGHHHAQPGTRLGRYGVGLKDMSIWLGGPMDVESRRNGQKMKGRVDWEDIARRGDWLIPDPSYVLTGEANGTILRFKGIAHEPPDGRDFQRLADELGFMYLAALRNGHREITLRHHAKGAEPIVVKPFDPPPFSELVDQTCDVGGKTIRIHVGLVNEGESNPKPGISYCHGFRVVLPCSSLGCGDFSSARLAGSVLLGEGWNLAKNKDDIVGDPSELATAVHRAILPLLRKASAQAEILEVAGIEGEMTTLVRKMFVRIREAKEKRNPGNSHGTHTATGTGRKRTFATETQSGRRELWTMTDVRAARFKFEFARMGDEIIGAIEAAGPTVRLSSDHPAVAQARTASDRRSLDMLMLGLLARHFADAEPNGQMFLPCLNDTQPDERFAKAYGYLLRKYAEKDAGKEGAE